MKDLQALRLYATDPLISYKHILQLKELKFLEITFDSFYRDHREQFLYGLPQLENLQVGRISFGIPLARLICWCYRCWRFLVATAWMKPTSSTFWRPVQTWEYCFFLSIRPSRGGSWRPCWRGGGGESGGGWRSWRCTSTLPMSTSRLWYPSCTLLLLPPISATLAFILMSDLHIINWDISILFI